MAFSLTQLLKKYIRWTLLALAVVVSIWFNFPDARVDFPEIQLGDVWSGETLKAPFSFPLLKSENQLAQEKENLLKGKTVVVSPIENWRIENAAIALNNYLRTEDIKAQFQTSAEVFNLCVDTITSQFRSILEQFKIVDQPTLNNSVFILNKNGKELKYPPKAFQSKQKSCEQLIKTLPQNCVPSSLESICNSFLLETYFVDSLQTQKRVEQLLSQLPVAQGAIQEGELIVSKGEILNTLSVRKLLSYKEFVLENNVTHSYWQIPTGKLGLIFLLLIVLAAYLSGFSRTTFLNARKSGFLVLLFAVLVHLTIVVEDFDSISPLIIPFCILPIITKAFFGSRIALFYHLIVLISCSLFVANPFAFFFIHLTAGFGIVLTNLRIHFWSQFFYSILLLLGLYIVAYTFVALSTSSLNIPTFTAILGNISVNVFLTMIAYPLIPLFEKGFGIISDLTLIELSNPDKPLLKRLRVKAPGTFQHSMQVANLAEAAASHIGANSLLIKVGALYHDIGKLKDAFYFIENQHGTNPHTDLSPLESAEKIIGHVTHGIELAEKNKLPKDLIRFIETHHGTTRVEYFYRTAVNQAEDSESVNPADFTYPGPRPSTKEEAILMLADTVEAAAKSLKEPTAEDLNALVENLVANKIQHGQLDKAPLTFRDVDIIKQEFQKILHSIYHVRIAYPKEKK